MFYKGHKHLKHVHKQSKKQVFTEVCQDLFRSNIKVIFQIMRSSCNGNVFRRSEQEGYQGGIVLDIIVPQKMYIVPKYTT